jgi:hypothetical protein
MNEEILIKAMHFEDRLNRFKSQFRQPASYPPYVSYSVMFNKFSTKYKKPDNLELPPIFPTTFLGHSAKAKSKRKTLINNNHIVSFIGAHHEVIGDLVCFADRKANNEVKDGCILIKIKWLELATVNPNQIYNISFDSCVNRKGIFDQISWVYFWNAWNQFYFNAINQYL